MSGADLWRSYVKRRAQVLVFDLDDELDFAAMDDAAVVVAAIAATEAAIVRAGVSLPILTRAELAAEIQRVLGVDELEQRIEASEAAKTEREACRMVAIHHGIKLAGDDMMQGASAAERIAQLIANRAAEVAS